LGEISFSFYMFHHMVILYLGKYRDSLRLGQSSDVILMAVAFAGSVIVAGLCYSWYEDPMRRKLRLFLMPRMSAASSAAGLRKAQPLARAA
jgi:peptidoglycan/LPS O-acetylase OafA/YrhL